MTQLNRPMALQKEVAKGILFVREAVRGREDRTVEASELKVQ